MKKLQDRLAAVAKRLGLMQPRLARAQRRYKSNRKRAFKAHEQQLAAQKKADRLRSEGKDATGVDARASRYGHTAHKNHARAQVWLGRVKVLQRKLNGLEADHAKIAAELKKAHKVSVRGNKVTGGTARQRLRVAIHTAAANCASGAQHNYYSMTGGAPDYGRMLKDMPYGLRFDCSVFGDGTYYVCDLPDPSGTDFNGGFTGTEGEHGRQVSESEAKTGDLVLYGPQPHHHVEVVDDPEAKTTIGHGSAPIDQGVFDLFGDGDYIVRSYV